MKQTDVIIIGGGQAGLAMSRYLGIRGVDHVVLERGRVGERWRRECWDSLRLLTPSSHSALPGQPHAAADPEGFLAATEFIAYLERYAAAIRAPLTSGVEVTAVKSLLGRYQVETTAGCWQSRAVIVATGACAVPFRPDRVERIADSIEQILPPGYRAPDRVPRGGVLVVGASSTGVQIAEESHASGRPVILAVGNHTRLPRRYRGRDIYAWMDDIGMLDERAEDSCNLEAARRQPSFQLVGRPDHRNLDLSILQAQGVRLVGRFASAEGRSVGFVDDLAASTTRAHERMRRVLGRIDAFIARQALEQRYPAAAEIPPFIGGESPTRLDLEREGVRSVVWATGYVRRYPWLQIPVLDGHGEILHRGGVTASPGLYVLGLTFQRRRRSHFIDGVGLDAAELSDLILTHLDSGRHTEIPRLRESRQ